MTLACFDTDMRTVVEDLKAGIVRKAYPPSPCAIIFTHDGDRLEAAKVNLFGKEILELCDGEHTLDQIARELQPRHGAGMEEEVFVAHCRDAVEAFQRMGLLAAAA